jgi:hypothetical protein
MAKQLPILYATGKALKVFPILAPLLFNIVLGIPARAVRVKK